MKKAYIIAMIVTALAASSSVFADTKIKSKQTVSGQSYENTTYIKGKRSRAEMMSGMMINITQCDLRRYLQVNPNAKTYIVSEMDQPVKPTTNASTDTGKNGVVVAGGKVTTSMSIKDTGEKKQMFGFMARHLIITMETVSSPDACTPMNSKMITDGWYIDAEFALDCDNGQANYGGYSGHKDGGCKDKYEFKQSGTGKRGYPLYEKLTMLDGSGNETMSTVTEVTELSKATLDTALFDVPSDYRQVSDAAQMYASSSGMSYSSASGSSSTSSSYQSQSSATANSIRSAAQGSSTSNAAPIGAKKAGTIRIGIANVKTGAVGDTISAQDLSAAVENTFKKYLNVPNVEVIDIDALLSSAIDAEAKAKDCDYVIYTNASHKKGGSGFGGFGAALGQAVGQVGIGHTGSTAGNIAGQVATQSIVSAGNMSANVKAKDEITLDVKLSKIDGQAAMAKVFKAKAKSNGDDIISNVIEQASESIVAAIGK